MGLRCLRAANRGLYLGTTMLVLAACGCILWQGSRPVWQLWLTAAAGLTTLLWGAWYVLLCYQVDAGGVTRRSMFGTRRILWNELAEAELEEQEGMGTARCAIHLRSCNGAQLCISSDVLPLDAVQELAAEMREQGILAGSHGEAA